MKNLLLFVLLLLLQGNTHRNLPAIEEKRLALVIGNAQYEHIGTLKNPVNDATDIAQTLKGFGFETFLHTDLKLKDMRANVEAFVKKIQDHKTKGHHVTALVYYAGHGIQHREANYLLPVEVNIQECDQLEYDAYLLKRLMVQVQSADVRIFMIDACRTPPKGNSCLRDLPTAGLKPISTSAPTANTDINLPQGTLISYSADADKPAEDGKGRNSPYAESFLKILRETPDKEANSLFDELVNEVWLKTNKVQSPWKNGSLKGGKFYFKKPENKPTPSLPTEKKEEPKKETTEKRGFDLPNFVYVEGGTFTMGCTNEQGSDCSEDEKTTKTLTVGSFMMSNAEVTVGEFAKFIQATGYQTDAEKRGNSYILKNEQMQEVEGITWRHNYKGALHLQSEYNHPVIHVSWNDAKAYCIWISKTVGRNYRLPTEAEWEYAARGGKKTKRYKYAGTTATIDDYAWYTDTTKDEGTKPVRTKKANELNLYDMSGNVHEWCDEWYTDNYNQYPTTIETYPVTRGGNWIFDSSYCRVSKRNAYIASLSNCYIGFRVAVSL